MCVTHAHSKYIYICTCHVTLVSRLPVVIRDTCVSSLGSLTLLNCVCFELDKCQGLLSGWSGKEGGA